MAAAAPDIKGTQDSFANSPADFAYSPLWLSPARRHLDLSGFHRFVDPENTLVGGGGEWEASDNFQDLLDWLN